MPNTPQVSTLFALEEANKRPQTAQEEAAAPGPAGLEHGGAAGELSLPLFLWEVYLLSQPCGGFNQPVLGLWGRGQSHGLGRDIPTEGARSCLGQSWWWRADGGRAEARGPRAVRPCGAGGLTPFCFKA